MKDDPTRSGSPRGAGPTSRGGRGYRDIYDRSRPPSFDEKKKYVYIYLDRLYLSINRDRRKDVRGIHHRPLEMNTAHVRLSIAWYVLRLVSGNRKT